MIARFSFSTFVSIIGLILTVSAVLAVTPAFSEARSLTWEEPSTKYQGVPLFWKFLEGYIAYYNLNGKAVSDIELPNDADIIIAHTQPGDTFVEAINVNNVPVVYSGHRFWFRPSLAWGYGLIFSYIHGTPRNIVVVHRTQRCSELSWWYRWWRPCAPAKSVTHYFEAFDWPGQSNSLARNIKIKYSANITDATTGEEIQNGATVPVGTQLRLSFGEHTGGDITWTGAKHWRPLLSYLRMRYGWSQWGWWIWNERAFWQLYPKGNTGVWVDEGQLPHAACRDEDFVFTRSVWRFNRNILGNILNYITMSVEKPERTIDGLDGLGCTMDGDDYLCTLSEEGLETFNFTFAPTDLSAYHSYKKPRYAWASYWWGWQGFNTCLGVDNPMYKRNSEYSVSTNCTENGRCWSDAKRNYYKYRFSYVGGSNSPNTPHYFTPFEVVVPEQVISYSISVENQNSAPAVPTITGDENVLVDSEATFSITSTDPNTDTLRYGIDWDTDTNVDEWLPASGYTISGNSESTSKSWNETGEVTFKVLAEDANGARSEWGEFSINVLDEPTLNFSAGEYLVAKNDSALLSWSTEHVSSCTASGNWSGTKAAAGSERTETLTEFQNEYTLSCSNALASTSRTLSIYTYACGDSVCTTNVETCATCSADCGTCGDAQSTEWDVFLDLTEDPPQVRYGGGSDEVGN